MKKILLILVATLGLTANAQTGFKKSDVFVEGSFSYAKEKDADATYTKLIYEKNNLIYTL